MNKSQAAAEILTHALPRVPFEGWTQAMLGNAALAAGYKRTDAIRVFPGGAMDAVEAWMRCLDAEMLAGLAGYHLETMKIRERVAAAVRLRLEAAAPHREALRRALALQALPFHAHHALGTVYRTVDEIWHAIGDTSTDFNFYTKRLMLAAVYVSTERVFLDDRSQAFAQSWEFLARRIDNVMTIEKVKARLRESVFRRAG